MVEVVGCHLLAYLISLHISSPEAQRCPQQTESIAALLPSHPRANNKTRTITVRWISVFSRNILLICLDECQEAEGREISGNEKKAS